jgi:formylglycine-generating enzyme required for sulfatase activity
MGGADPNQTADDPEHLVTLSPYQIGRWEVTNGRFRACVTAGACTPPATPRANYTTCDRCPLVGVLYDQAVAFCTWDGRRLPTEAEFEKAGRGGADASNPLPRRIYPWGDTTPSCAEANIAGCAAAYEEPVDSHPAGASIYGVERLLDGAAEFLEDWYSETYYSVSPAVDPRGPATGFWRSGRGRGDAGPLFSFPFVTTRDYYNPVLAPIGFRCAR